MAYVLISKGKIGKITEQKSRLKVMREIYAAHKSVPLALSSISDFSIVASATACHFDSFGSDSLTKQSLIETKMECAFGKPDHSWKLPPCGTLSSPVCGALYYPMYGVGTSNGVGNFEGHVLARTVHGSVAVLLPASSPSLPPPKKAKTELSKKKLNVMRRKEKLELMESSTCRRGVWKNGTFYPEGMAVLDWDSLYTGASAAATRYRETHPRNNPRTIAAYNRLLDKN